MGKLLKISEEEKKRILEMHFLPKTLIKEQNNIEQQVVECMMSVFTLNDVVQIKNKYPKTLELGIAFISKKQINFDMIKNSYEELIKDDKYACDKISKLIACISKKNNIPIDNTLQSAMNTVCRGAAQITKTVTDVIKNFPNPGGSFPKF